MVYVAGVIDHRSAMPPGTFRRYIDGTCRGRAGVHDERETSWRPAADTVELYNT